MFAAQEDVQYSLLYFKHLRHNHSESHHSDTVLRLIICVRVCVHVLRVKEQTLKFAKLSPAQG